MDLEPGRIRVHEHAETGKPLAAHVHGIRSRFSPSMAPPARGFRPGRRLGWNGPAAADLPIVRCTVGHNLSAIGSPHQTACSSGIMPLGVQRAAPPGRPPCAPRRPGDSQVIPPAYPRPFRSRVCLSLLAAPRFSVHPEPQPPRPLGFLLKRLPQMSQLVPGPVSRSTAHTPAGQCRWTERYDG
jgi:hypothetical protein